MSGVKYFGPTPGRAFWVLSGASCSISLEEVEAATGVSYAPEQKNALALKYVPFHEDVLWACRGSHVLFPGQPLSLVDTHRVFGYPTFPKWWAKEGSVFPGVEPRWYLVRKGPLPDSTFCDWETQQRMLPVGTTVPSVSSVAFADFLFRKVRRNVIITSPARCSGGTVAVSPSSEGVGISNKDGLGAGLPGVMVEWIPHSVSV